MGSRRAGLFAMPYEVLEILYCAHDEAWDGRRRGVDQGLYCREARTDSDSCGGGEKMRPEEESQENEDQGNTTEEYSQHGGL